MRVELQVVSPEVKLDGFDLALKKIDQVESGLARLAALKQLDFKVSVSAPGLQSLRRDLAGLEANGKNLAEALQEAGTKGALGLAEQISKGTLPARDAFQQIRLEAARMGDVLAVSQRKTKEYWMQFGQERAASAGFTGEAEKLEKGQALLREREAKEMAYLQKYEAIRRAEGIAQSMANAPIKETAAAEGKLADAQSEAMAGMRGQTTLAEAKAKAMGQLRKEVDETAVAEKKLDASMGASAARLDETAVAADLLSQKYRKVGEMENVLVQTKHTGGSGVTITKDVVKGRVETLVDLETQRKEAAAQAEILRTVRDREAEIKQQQTLAQTRMQAFGQTQKQWGTTPDVRFTEHEGGRRETSSIDREVNGRRELLRLTVDYDHAGQAMKASLGGVNTAIEAVEKTTRGYGRTLLNGIGSFAGFVAASSAVYGSVELMKKGFESFANIERQTAVLRTVFRGTEDETLQLRDSVLSLAVSYGRSADEAMDAAVRWARIGLTAQQTTEAVAISLQAANIAQVTAAESAEQLSAVYASFGLSISEVRVALNEMDRISHSVNVTVKDLMAGMQRVSGIAHQAGLSVAETMGLIAGTVSRTGRSGSEAGNALKAMIAAISKPELQNFLKTGFKLDVKTDTGDIQQFNAILSELFQTYQKLTDAERQELLVKLGGKQQASRFAAILDGYIASQRLAIEAQLDMNRADRENSNIRQTLISQLGSMGAMFEKLSVDMAMAGGSMSLNSTLTEFVKLLTHAMALMDKAPMVMAVLAAVALTMAGRMLMSAASMQDGATKANYLTGTLHQLSAVYETLAAAIDQANTKLVMQDGLLGRLGASAMGVSGRANAMRGGVAAGIMSPDMGEKAMGGAVAGASGIQKGVGFLIGAIPALMKFTAWMIAISAVTYGLNKIFEHFESDAEKARRKLAGFNDEMERLHNVSRASEMQARLAGTLQSSIANTAARDPGAARRNLYDFAMAANPGDARGALALGDELKALLEANKMSELEARLGALKLGMQKQNVGAKLDELARSREITGEMQRQIAEQQKQLRSLNGSKREEAAQKILQLETEASKELQRQLATEQDIVDIESERGEDMDDHKKDWKDVSKERIETTKRIGEAMPKLEGPVATWEREQQSNAINIQQTKERIRLLEEQKRATTEAAAVSLSKARGEVAALETLAITRKENIKRAMTGLEIPGSQWGMLADVNPNLAQEHTRIGTGAGMVPTDPGDPRVNEARESLRRQQAEREAGLSALAAASSVASLAGYDNLRELTQDYEAKRKVLEATENQGKAEQAILEKRKAAEQEQLKELVHEQKLLKVRQERAQIEGQIKEGDQRAKEAGERARIGRTEGEKLINEFNALNPLDSHGDVGKTAQIDATLGGETASPFADQAEMLGRLQRMEETLNSATERRNHLVAETVNLRRQEAEEASKALQTASREEQLRAAATAAFINKRGGQGFNSSEFQFLDRASQEAITRFNPSSAPPELQNGADRADREKGLLDSSIDGMKEILDRTKATIEAFLKPAQAPGNVDIDRPPPPQVNPTINVSLGDQFNGLVDKLVQAVQNDIQRVEDKVDAFLTGSTIASAQSASQGIA